jgi:hypothetical protein
LLVNDLVVVDPQTGQSEHCGVITTKRTIGKITVWLTYDAPNLFWWIVWRDDRLRKAGFIEARREVCWELFEGLDEKAIDDLRDRRSPLPNCSTPEPLKP